MDPKREVLIQSVAEEIFKLIVQLPSRADCAAALSLVQCALIWQENPSASEVKTTQLLQCSMDGAMEMWKEQAFLRGVSSLD
jgi:hypothetical protein